MNLVEVWFAIIERQAIHRGTFSSVKDLNTKIRAFIDGWNDRGHPFVWTKTADQILKKANRQQLQTRGTSAPMGRWWRVLYGGLRLRTQLRHHTRSVEGSSG